MQYRHALEIVVCAVSEILEIDPGGISEETEIAREEFPAICTMIANQTGVTLPMPDEFSVDVKELAKLLRDQSEQEAVMETV